MRKDEKRGQEKMKKHVRSSSRSPFEVPDQGTSQSESLRKQQGCPAQRMAYVKIAGRLQFSQLDFIFSSNLQVALEEAQALPIPQISA